MGRRSASSLQRNFQIIYIDAPSLSFGDYFTAGSYSGQWLSGSSWIFSLSLSHLVMHFPGNIFVFFLEEFSIMCNLRDDGEDGFSQNLPLTAVSYNRHKGDQVLPSPQYIPDHEPYFTLGISHAWCKDGKPPEAGSLVISWPHLSYSVPAAKPLRFPCFLFLKPIFLACFQFWKLLISFQLIPFLLKIAGAHVCCLQPRGWQMKMFYSCLPTQLAQLFASFSVFHDPWKCLLEMPHSQRAHSVGLRWLLRTTFE